MKEKITDTQNTGVDPQRLQEYIDTLSKMLRCKTVWTENGENIGEYERFYSVLKESFPLLHSKTEHFVFDSCLIYKINGNSNENILLMSHHDVVDGSPNWDTPPFGAVVKDGLLFSRGSIDTKTPLFAEMQAAEELLQEGFSFPVNVYIASSGNEEVSGNGILNALDFFKQNDVKFRFILDEGGAIVENMVPGVKRQTAMVAVHEKGRHGYSCVVEKDAKKDGGHSGLTCKTDNPIVRMSAFITEVEKTQWTRKFYPEVKATFTACAPYMPTALKFVFKNLNLFQKPLLKIIPKISSAAAGMLGTTLSFTQIRARGGSENIQAKAVEATAFFRCVREKDLLKDVEKFTEIGKKYGIKVAQISADYCPPTDFNGKEFAFVKSVINSNFPSVVVAPFLLTAGTDARRLYPVSDNILRFAPISLSAKQFATVHSDNENIATVSVGEAVAFYKTLITRILP